MKITIYAPETPTSGHTIYDENNNRIRNSHNNLRSYDFDEDEILFILGEKEFSKFEQGKYTFNVPVSMLNIIQDKPYNLQNRSLLVTSTNWNNFKDWNV